MTKAKETGESELITAEEAWAVFQSADKRIRAVVRNEDDSLWQKNSHFIAIWKERTARSIRVAADKGFTDVVSTFSHPSSRLVRLFIRRELQNRGYHCVVKNEKWMKLYNREGEREIQVLISWDKGSSQIEPTEADVDAFQKLVPGVSNAL